MTKVEIVNEAKHPGYVVLTGDRTRNDTLIETINQLTKCGELTRWSSDGNPRELVKGDESLNNTAVGIRLPARRIVI